MKHKPHSIGRDAALALYATEWWKRRSATEIAHHQLHVAELCCPFDVFHQALEKALGRPVWTHEMGLNWDGLVDELNGDKPMPSFEDIVNLVPEHKRLVVASP